MTFPNRSAIRETGSGVYAHALLQCLESRADVMAAPISATAGGGFGHTLRWLARDARRSLLTVRPDVLHCPAFVTPWRSPVPVVITMHDAGAFRHSGDFNREWRAYNRYFLPRIARRAAAVIVGTQWARGELARYYGIDPARIHVTRYGVDASYRRPLRKEKVACLRARLSENLPLLLFSGAPSPRKNLDVVLEAMAAAKTGNPLSEARLMISGDTGDAFSAYLERVRARGLEGRVTWLGRIATDDMPELYAAADVLVYPSLYEGFGLPPLEAMAIGTPVVASSIPVLSEVLGDAALFVPPRDHEELAATLDALLTHPDVRSQAIDRGRRQSALYTWEQCAAETVGVYRAAAGYS